MKFTEDTLVITCNATQAVRIKINSLRTPKNYLVPVTKKVIPNRYRPYTVTATTNFSNSIDFANGKGCVNEYASGLTFADIITTGYLYRYR